MRQVTIDMLHELPQADAIRLNPIEYDRYGRMNQADHSWADPTSPIALNKLEPGYHYYVRAPRERAGSYKMYAQKYGFIMDHESFRSVAGDWVAHPDVELHVAMFNIAYPHRVNHQPYRPPRVIRSVPEYA